MGKHAFWTASFNAWLKACLGCSNTQGLKISTENVQPLFVVQ